MERTTFSKMSKSTSTRGSTRGVNFSTTASTCAQRGQQSLISRRQYDSPPQPSHCSTWNHSFLSNPSYKPPTPSTTTTQPPSTTTPSPPSSPTTSYHPHIPPPIIPTYHLPSSPHTTSYPSPPKHPPPSPEGYEG
jgi:hypothetical protein